MATANTLVERIAEVGKDQQFRQLLFPFRRQRIGATANDNGLGFTQTAGVLVNLTRSSNAVTGGTFNNPIVDLDTVFGAAAESREAELLAGKWYINLHTVNNGGGEMRGFLVAVPEPTAPLLGLLGLGSFALRRRRA